MTVPACVSPCLQIWWLDPELTYGNAKPFVFTQGHSVCNRSFFPCFDTPAVKCTYSAVVKVGTTIGVVSASFGHCQGWRLQKPCRWALATHSCTPLVCLDWGPSCLVGQSWPPYGDQVKGPGYSTEKEMLPDNWFPRPLDLQELGGDS